MESVPTAWVGSGVWRRLSQTSPWRPGWNQAEVHLAGRAYTLKLLGRTKEAIAVAADAVACGNHPPAEALHAELLRAARLDQMAQTLPDAAQASTHAGAECTEDDAD